MSMKMLCRESLSPAKQQVLDNLIQTPAWKIIRELLQDCTRQALNECISIRTEDPDYERKVSSAQRHARAVSEVVESLIRSIDVHAESVSVRTSDDGL
jgi:hypothetical protein